MQDMEDDIELPEQAQAKEEQQEFSYPSLTWAQWICQYSSPNVGFVQNLAKCLTGHVSII